MLYLIVLLTFECVCEQKDVTRFACWSCWPCGHTRDYGLHTYIHYRMRAEGGYVNVLLCEMNIIKCESIKQTLLALAKWVVRQQANMRHDLAPRDRQTGLMDRQRDRWRDGFELTGIWEYATDNAGICITLANVTKEANSMWDSLNRFVMLPHESHDCTRPGYCTHILHVYMYFIYMCYMHMAIWLKWRKWCFALSASCIFSKVINSLVHHSHAA